MRSPGPRSRPFVRAAVCCSAAVALVTGSAVSVPARADAGPRPSTASPAPKAAGDRDDAEKFAASVGLTVEQLDRGLRAAKRAWLGGDLEAAVTAFAQAAPTIRRTAARVVTDLAPPAKDQSSATKVRTPGPEKQPSPGRAPGVHDRAAVAHDRAAVARFASLLGVSPAAAARALQRLTEEGGGRVTSSSSFFAEVAKELGVSVQRLGDATRALKTWLVGQEGGGRKDGAPAKPGPRTATAPASDH